jgi:hypothetical protein
MVVFVVARVPGAVRACRRPKGLHVIDGSGSSVGVPGVKFRLGGGEAPSMEHARLSPERRAAAESR